MPLCLNISKLSKAVSNILKKKSDNYWVWSFVCFLVCMSLYGKSNLCDIRIHYYIHIFLAYMYIPFIKSCKPQFVQGANMDLIVGVDIGFI